MRKVTQIEHRPLLLSSPTSRPDAAADDHRFHGTRAAERRRAAFRRRGQLTQQLRVGWSVDGVINGGRDRTLPATSLIGHLVGNFLDLFGNVGQCVSGESS